MKKLGQIHSFPTTNTLTWPNNPALLEFITNVFVQYNTHTHTVQYFVIKAPKLSNAICYLILKELRQLEWTLNLVNGNA